MKVEITISNLYYNTSLMNFFFRTQSENTFNEIIESIEEPEEAFFEALENYSNDLDDIEEMLYSDSNEDICINLGLTLKN